MFWRKIQSDSNHGNLFHFDPDGLVEQNVSSLTVVTHESRVSVHRVLELQESIKTSSCCFISFTFLLVSITEHHSLLFFSPDTENIRLSDSRADRQNADAVAAFLLLIFKRFHRCCCVPPLLRILMNEKKRERILLGLFVTNTCFAHSDRQQKAKNKRREKRECGRSITHAAAKERGFQLPCLYV